jgi:hypothetical protein
VGLQKLIHRKLNLRLSVNLAKLYTILGAVSIVLCIFPLIFFKISEFWVCTCYTPPRPPLVEGKVYVFNHFFKGAVIEGAE